MLSFKHIFVRFCFYFIFYILLQKHKIVIEMTEGKKSSSSDHERPSGKKKSRQRAASLSRPKLGSGSSRMVEGNGSASLIDEAARVEQELQEEKRYR